MSKQTRQQAARLRAAHDEERQFLLGQGEASASADSKRQDADMHVKGQGVLMMPAC